MSSGTIARSPPVALSDSTAEPSERCHWTNSSKLIDLLWFVSIAAKRAPIAAVLRVSISALNLARVIVPSALVSACANSLPTASSNFLRSIGLGPGGAPGGTCEPMSSPPPGSISCAIACSGASASSVAIPTMSLRMRCPFSTRFAQPLPPTGAVNAGLIRRRRRGQKLDQRAHYFLPPLRALRDQPVGAPPLVGPFDHLQTALADRVGDQQQRQHRLAQPGQRAGQRLRRVAGLQCGFLALGHRPAGPFDPFVGRALGRDHNPHRRSELDPFQLARPIAPPHRQIENGL